MTEFPASEWARAQKTLSTAQLLVSDDPDSSASRAYYAAFHALTALFALRGRNFTKHSAIRAALHRDVIKPGEWDVSLGRDYDYLPEMREVGDYGGTTRVSAEDAQEALLAAQRVLQAVEQACPQLRGRQW